MLTLLFELNCRQWCVVAVPFASTGRKYYQFFRRVVWWK